MMSYKKMMFIFLFLAIGQNSLLAQEDTSIYEKKYAFAPQDPNQAYEVGQEFLLAFGLYKVWGGKTFSWGFYDETTSEKLTSAKYDTLIFRYLYQEKRGFYIISENNKWGMLAANRSVLVENKYDKLNYVSTSHQHYISIELAGKYGILDPDGKLILDATYDDVLFDGYRYKVRQGTKWGLRNAKGEELIPTCFDKVEDHSYVSHTRVQLGDKWSVFNWIKDKPCACEIKFDAIEYLGAFFVVRDKTKFALLDIDKKEILPLEYDFMAPFFLKYLNSILVGKDKKVGVLRIDSTGKAITEVPILYDDIWVDETTMKIKVQLKDKIDYYYNNQTLFNLAYNDLQYYENIDRVMVKKGTKWGMMTVEGEQILPISYAKIHVMNKDQFMVQKGKSWGVLNGRGQEIIPVIYDAFDYRPEKQFFFVQKAGKWGIVSLTKGVILPPDYEDMHTLSNRTYLVKKKGLWGVVGPGGRVIVPLEYSSYDYKFQGKEILLKHHDGSTKKHSLN